MEELENIRVWRKFWWNTWNRFFFYLVELIKQLCLCIGNCC